MSEEFEEWEGASIAPEPITCAFSKPGGTLDLTLPLCSYEVRGKAIFVQRKHPEWHLAPEYAEFRPVRNRHHTGLMSAWVPVRNAPMCVHPSRLMRRASLSDIVGVVGTSFYTTATDWVGRNTLMAWLDGIITTYEAGTHGSNILKQLGVVYSPGMARAEPKRKPASML